MVATNNRTAHCCRYSLYAGADELLVVSLTLCDDSFKMRHSGSRFVGTGI